MNGRLLPRDALTPAQRDRMFRLLAGHFEDVERDGFERDLAEKNWVILLEDEREDLRGFSTLLFYEQVLVGARSCHVVCSGDTIVEPSAWGSTALLASFLHGTLRLKRRFAGARPLHWLLLTSGYRTYRFLPVFWQSFWPRCGTPTPPAAQDLMHRLARARFGDAYDPTVGIVRFERPQRLGRHLAGIPGGRRADPHVRYFERRNPGHADGDELVCLAELHPANLTRAGRRVLAAPGAFREPSGAEPDGEPSADGPATAVLRASG